MVIGSGVETWELNSTRATTAKRENAGVAGQGRAITAQFKTSELQQVTGASAKTGPRMQFDLTLVER